MKKAISLLIAVGIFLLTVFPACAVSNTFLCDSFIIMPPEQFIKTEIEGTDVAYTVQTEDGQTIYFLLVIGEVPGLEPYTAMTNYDYFTAFDKVAAQGEFISMNHFVYANIVPVLYTTYKTEKNIRILCCFPGYGHEVAIVVLSPLDHDPTPELEILTKNILPRQ